jgi:hypothetical protein
MISLIVPAWIAAGLLDYIWRRRTKIETTSGPRESLLQSVYADRRRDERGLPQFTAQEIAQRAGKGSERIDILR